MHAYMPPAMAATVARHEAAEAAEAERAEAARVDEAVLTATVREHLDHAHEAITGYTPAELREAQQARIDALAAIDWDASAPLGSPRYPEVLIGGASVAGMAGSGAVEAARAKYEAVGGTTALMARNAAEAAAWNSPEMRRIQRAAELAAPQVPARSRRPAGFRARDAAV
jgi:hypothetical protein